ncbi:MAG: flagellar biosynthetic protein FliO [Methylotenera sp.]|uniref:flagellar biosynthetic protein FliO n=1 Tax=Methylotenera sp. TaxID=2051956 RepID=UPI0027353A85|nr:flagellar biosynthetic protein FliO [Methylotenera sp.]MDP3086612.1 flagellar biosynthetic protein FliO [Methylotenera sp.]MDP3776491.1 flagellar biosynthetic protein FliO [Methylotenera sp.]
MKFKLLFISIFYWISNSAWSADAVVQTSPTGGLLKMALGLMLVLGVMAGVAWLAKRMLPGVGNKQSTIHVVGSANVGTRERVVVLEVAGRWLVVGVAPGQVSAIANLEMGATDKDAVVTNESVTPAQHAESLATSFGKILKSSASKFTEKTNG